MSYKRHPILNFSLPPLLHHNEKFKSLSVIISLIIYGLNSFEPLNSILSEPIVAETPSTQDEHS